MTKAINKMLAVVLSFAMVITGFTFLGGAVSANAETQTDTITIKVVDQNGNGVSGVSLLCTDADDNDFSYGTTNEEGTATHKIDKSQEYYEEEAEYEVTAENCEVTSPVVFTISEFQSGENTGMFFNTVNGEPYYEDDIAELVIKTEEPQPTGFEITFDPGEDATLAEGESTAMTNADGKLETLPTPTMNDEDYIFGGWLMYTGEGDEPEEVKVTTDTVFTEDTTVYANWIYKYWTPEDFTYGEWEYTGSVMIDGQTLKEMVWGITGLSESGSAKIEFNKDMVIPYEDENGKPVHGIKANVFKSQGLKSVELPSGVTTDEGRGDFFIEASAFERNEIEKVTIPEGVISVGTYAFRYNSLQEVIFPSTLMVIEPGAFAYNSDLSKASFNEEAVLGVGMQAFARDGFTDVQLPKNTVQLNQYAFMQNPAVVNVYIDGKEADGTLIQENTRSHKVINGVLTYKATLNANDGNEYDPINIEYGKLTEPLPFPDKEGFAFLGWFDSEEGGKEVTEESIFNSDVTIYAHWSDCEELADAQQKTYDAFDASYDAAMANEAAKEAAKTPGEAAVNAAKAAQQKAQDAVNKAKAAKEAAKAAVAALEAADNTDGEEYKLAQQLAEDAEMVLEESNNLLNEANDAVSKAETAKANADAVSTEAARQGTPDPSLPKVKISKPKAAKGAVTAKWKKLTKKNQKKADRIEVWVCPDKNFAAVNTKEKVVSKKKASVKVKGLNKKTTYFVKVRTIKNVNGVKYVGPWSKVKKIKTK